MNLKILQVKEAKGEQFNSPQSIAEMMCIEAKADREYFWVLHLNTKNKVIDKEPVSIGCLNSTIVHGREVFRKAVLNSTSSIVTVHNHPSNTLDPSNADYQTWEKLRQAGRILGIEIIDNLIITPDGKYWSEHENKT